SSFSASSSAESCIGSARRFAVAFGFGASGSLSRATAWARARFSGGLLRLRARLRFMRLTPIPAGSAVACQPPFHSYNPRLSRASGLGRMSAGKRPVAIIMGSQSDWETLRFAAAALDELGIGHDSFIVSAHRTPDRLYKFAKSARKKGYKVVIAGA